MNKKLIALAVAGVVAAPVVAQADANWYGSIRTSLAWDQGKAKLLNTGEYSPGEEEDSWDIRDHSSRFGVKGSNDLGNGLKGIYRYEFKVSSDKAQLGDQDRLSYVGLGGDWGAVLLGRQWSPYYNALGGFDVFNSVGLAFYQGTFRLSNTLAYAWNNDNHMFQLAGVFNGDDGDDGEDIDGWQAGYKGNWGGFNAGIGYNKTNGVDLADTIWGITLGYNYAENSNVWVNWEDAKDVAQDWTLIWEHGIGANILRLGYSSLSADSKNNPLRIHSSDTSQWMLGWQYNLSDNTRVAIEYASTDVDQVSADATTETLKLKGDELRFFVRTDF